MAGWGWRGYGVDGDALLSFAGLFLGSFLGCDTGFAKDEVFGFFVGGEGLGTDEGCGRLAFEAADGQVIALLVGVVAGWLREGRFGVWLGLGRGEVRGFFLPQLAHGRLWENRLSRDGARMLLGGELDGVEEEVGAAVVDRLAGEVGGNGVEGFEHAVARFERGQGEGVVGDDGDGGLVGDAVLEAGVLVVAGVGSATDAVGVPVHALVRLEWFELGLLVFVHWCLHPPGGYISLSCSESV